MWDKMVEKTVDVEAKAIFQPSFEIKEIDSRFPIGYRPLVKKDKNDTNREHRNEAPKDKAKSHNSSFVNQT